MEKINTILSKLVITNEEYLFLEENVPGVLTQFIYDDWDKTWLNQEVDANLVTY